MSTESTDLQQLYWRKVNQAFASDRLELTILPTERCNFRCVYCYEDFAVGRMAPDTVEAVKRLLTRRAPELRLLQTRWFGGEPLLALDVIEAIASHAVALTRAHPQLQQRGSVTTNGWHLTADVAARLCALNIDTYQISLDGPRELHDTTRLTAGGHGSHDRIHANLRALRGGDLPFHVELRFHLTPANVAVADRYVDFLQAEYLGDPRFHLAFFPVARLGGSHDTELDILEHDAAVQTVRRLRERVEPPRQADAPATDPYVCYAAKGNAFIVRANGRIAKCTVGFGEPRNDVGHLAGDGTVVFDQERARAWLGGWGHGDWSALQCPASRMPRAERLTPITRGRPPARPAADLKPNG